MEAVTPPRYTVQSREELAKENAPVLLDAYLNHIPQVVAEALLDGYNRLAKLAESVRWLAANEGGKVKAKYIRKGGEFTSHIALREYREAIRQAFDYENPTLVKAAQGDQALYLLRKLVAAYHFQDGTATEFEIQTIAGR